MQVGEYGLQRAIEDKKFSLQQATCKPSKNCCKVPWRARRVELSLLEVSDHDQKDASLLQGFYHRSEEDHWWSYFYSLVTLGRKSWIRNYESLSQIDEHAYASYIVMSLYITLILHTSYL